MRRLFYSTHGNSTVFEVWNFQATALKNEAAKSIWNIFLRPFQLYITAEYDKDGHTPLVSIVVFVRGFCGFPLAKRQSIQCPLYFFGIIPTISLWLQLFSVRWTVRRCIFSVLLHETANLDVRPQQQVGRALPCLVQDCPSIGQGSNSLFLWFTQLLPSVLDRTAAAMLSPRL